MIFCHDLHHLLRHFNSEYRSFLNSEDRFDTELPLTKNQAFGGTMAMWKVEHDAYITIHPVLTTSFLPLVFSPPGSPVTVHIVLYLPTSGRETEFIEQIILLRSTILELQDKHRGSLVYLRGDSNVNPNNKNRMKIFTDFLSTFNLSTIPLHHKTYHHFLGNGLFDSEIDVLILQTSALNSEKVCSVLCSEDFPDINSHHDIILSTLTVPVEDLPEDKSNLVTAPRVPNSRRRVIWSEENLIAYQNLLSPLLSDLRSNWSNPNSPASFSLLLQITNDALNYAASATNKTIALKSPTLTKRQGIPRKVRIASQKLKKAHTQYKKAPENTKIVLFQKLVKARKEYRSTVRKQKHQDNIQRDSHLYSICTNNPDSFYRKIRSAKRSTQGSVPFLTVGDKVYSETEVPDGMFDSISSLKSRDLHILQASPYYTSWSEDYRNILKLAKNKRDLPAISLNRSNKILVSMKPSVSDFWSVTPLHFRNAGTEGQHHFNFLMNQVISNINNSTAKELNTVYALLLHKAHGKSRTSDRSYRTISSCPVLAKALDMYIHELFTAQWNAAQAPMQYQGEGSSHMLASLLVTESVQQSLHHHHQPVFLLFLDARSAFDTVVISFLVRALYHTGMQGNSLNYIHNRLHNRITYCDWDKTLMGPIFDQQGLEQGGCNSSDLYKIYNNELLEVVQQSCQGVDLGNGLVVSGVGQADDIALISSDIHNLFNILQLALNYCQKYCVSLCPDKTKLVVMTSKKEQKWIPYNPISFGGKDIGFSTKAEHVGVIRSSDGNLPNLLSRFTAHRRALAALLFAGIARNHRGNISASLKIEKIFALPVLLSGLASLVLSKAEVNMIDQHYVNTLKNLLKVHNGTPQVFVLFMSGSLPCKALLHLRMLSLFSMISRLPNDPLFLRAKYALTVAQQSWKSWFSEIRALTLLYGLPHPLSLLEHPLPKETFKKLAKSAVLGYWERKLRAQAALLPSLVYFKPEYHSLVKAHPILWTSRSNPYEVAKSVIQLKMLSGRYRVAMLTKHWSVNRSDSCPAPGCHEPETLEHLLLSCRYYDQSRLKLKRLWGCTKEPLLSDLLLEVLSGPAIDLVQFILDASVHPTVIRLVQTYGHEPLVTIFYLTRTWCYTLHRERLKLLGHFKFD